MHLQKTAEEGAKMGYHVPAEGFLRGFFLRGFLCDKV